MRFKIISVGRETADKAAPLTAEYLLRISKFFPIENIVIKPVSEKRDTESMIKAASTADVLIAMDQHGKMYDSERFAELIESWMTHGISLAAFLIGKAEGLPEEIKKKADLKVSLSLMTFPHRLAKLFLTEQIYRALCSIRNIPYLK